MAKSYPLRLVELKCVEHRMSRQASVMWLVSTEFHNFALLTALYNKDAVANIAKLMARGPQDAEKLWSLPLTQTASWLVNPQTVGDQLDSITKQLAECNTTGNVGANIAWHDFEQKCKDWRAVLHGAGKPSLTRLTLDGFYYDEFKVHGSVANNAVAERGFYYLDDQEGRQSILAPVYEVQTQNSKLVRIEHITAAELEELKQKSYIQARERYGIYESPRAVKPQSAKNIAPPAIVNSTRPELNDSDPIHIPRELREALNQIARNFGRI